MSELQHLADAIDQARARGEAEVDLMLAGTALEGVSDALRVGSMEAEYRLQSRADLDAELDALREQAWLRQYREERLTARRERQTQKFAGLLWVLLSAMLVSDLLMDWLTWTFPQIVGVWP
ncbi:MAG: hypothetical protein AAFX07_00640 [Pseudomonadota bacterium]